MGGMQCSWGFLFPRFTCLVESARRTPSLSTKSYLQMSFLIIPSLDHTCALPLYLFQFFHYRFFLLDTITMPGNFSRLLGGSDMVRLCVLL